MTWLEGWGKRRKLIIDGSKVTEGLANYPLCFLISSGTGINNADLSDVFEELERPAQFIDTFSGSDYSSYDIERWFQAEGTGSAYIYDNRLRIDTNSSFIACGLVSQTYYVGDVDFYITLSGSPGNPSAAAHYSSITFIGEDGKHWYLYYHWQGSYWNLEAQSYDGATYRNEFTYNNGTTNNTKLRLTRVGSTWAAYRWDGAAWVLMGNSAYMNSTYAVRLRIRSESYSAGYPAYSIYWDDATFSGAAATIAYNKKIAFATETAAQCYTEIESWDSLARSACLWVRIPTVTPTADTELYFYYDKDHADNLAYVGNIGDTVSRNVWDDNFVAVYHLAQRPTTGSKTVFDSSKYQNNLQPTNTEPYSDLINGMCGKAIQFDGGEYLEATDANSLDITTTSTLEALIYPTTAEQVDEVICKTPNDAGGYQFRADYGVPAFYFGGSSAGEGTLWTSRWSYYAGTNNVSGQVRYFRDGQLVSSGTGGTTPANTNTLRIGARWDSYYFNGTMDEIRISNIDRSPAYCTLNYYNMWDNLLTISGVEDDPPPPEPEPTWLDGWSKRIKLTVDGTKVSDNLSNFPLLVILSSGTGRTNADVTDVFDELSPDDGAFTDAQYTKLLLHMDDTGLTDSSPMHYNITKNGNTHRSSSQSKFDGYSAYFDGTDDWLSLSSDIVTYYMSTGPSTIDCWVYFDTLAGGTSYWGNPIFSKSQNGGSGEQLFWINTNGSVNFNRAAGAGSAFSFGTTSGVVTINNWHHVALTVNGTYWRIFVDGVKRAEYANSTYWTNPSEVPNIGRVYIPSYSSYAGYYKGYIDELRVTSNAVWTSDFTPPTRAYTYGSENAKKIAVTSSDCVTQQYVEIEWWDAINKKAYLWAKAPALASGVNTELYLYYDASQPDNTTYVGLTGEGVARNVWDSNHTGVWHFNTVPVAGSYTMLDSTGQINNGSPGSSVVLADTAYGKAYDFSNSTSSYVSIADDSSLDFSSTMTFMVFYVADSFPAGTFPIISKDVQGGNDYAYGITCNATTGSYSWADSDGAWGPTWQAIDPTLPVIAQWRLNTMTFNGSVVKHYHNGFYAAVSSSTAGTIRNNAAALRFGYSDRWSGYILDGKISEARASNIVRSDGWIKATYYTIVDDLLSFGATEDEARWRFSGTVAAKGSPVERLVLAYRRDTGELVGSATSVSGTGAFDLYTTYSGEHYVICLDDSEGDVYNALVYDYVIPTTVS